MYMVFKKRIQSGFNQSINPKKLDWIGSVGLIDLDWILPTPNTSISHLLILIPSPYSLNFSTLGTSIPHLLIIVSSLNILNF